MFTATSLHLIESLSMNVTVENLSALERRVSVRLPLADIEGEVDQRLKKLSRTVKLHGFRPGKVPFRLVAQQFGPQVRQEVLGDTVQRSFGEAVRERTGSGITVSSAPAPSALGIR